MSLYKKIRPYLFKGDPEKMHEFAQGALKFTQYVPYMPQVMGKYFSYPSSLLEQELFGTSFSNPFGLAGGFDKNADVLEAMSALGFGFLEVGSVTNSPSSGNDKPRLFRLEKDEALINRMGLNNVGAQKFLHNFHKARIDKPVFINITKSNNPSLNGEQAIRDIQECYEIVGSTAKVLVLNLSCPNTKDGKTFEDVGALRELLTAVATTREKFNFRHDLLLKLSNDVELSHLEPLFTVCACFSIQGYVVSNTSVSRTGLNTPNEVVESIGKGGLSGKPVFERSLERVRKVYELTEGQVPIVGVGGISTVEDCIRMFEAGASLLEFYTALVYEGPSLIQTLSEGVEREMIKRGHLSISDFRS